ncbi:MAG: ADP-ribosylglycohydrolase family protein [Proteobacteria bacterium]|nr:ADP-ribosylglycohydrolase family protein [Pseudomonadota bacterium]
MSIENENGLSPAVCRDRAAGYLVGLAIGDAFGDAARDPDNQFLYGITTDFPEKSTGSTDDTEFALLTAEILLRSNGDPGPEDVADAWRQHVLVQDELKRGGASEREAAANIRRGLTAPESGRFNAYAASDGAAMRAAPAGIVAAGDPDRAAQLAERDSEISHWGEGVWGAQAVAAAVSVAMAGGSVSEVFEEGMRRAPRDSWLRHNFAKALELIDSRGRDLQAVWMELHRILRGEYKASAPEAVVSAFAVFLMTDGDFRDGIVYSGNFGRDSDTVGAITGALAGAGAGLTGIPDDWAAKVRRPAGTCLEFTAGLDIVDVAHRLSGLHGS